MTRLPVLSTRDWILVHSLLAVGNLLMLLWGLSLDNIAGVCVSAFSLGVSVTLVGVNLVLWLAEGQEVQP